MIRKAQFLLSLLLLFPVIVLGARDSRPNILFILSDDHTSQAWGVYGGILDPYIDTPAIHRLAREGVLFRNAFCTNSICTPSRASILTGQYSHHNGVYNLNQPLDPARETLATLLQDAGYDTALFGKWHLVKKPSGFDTFQVLPGQGRYHDPLFKGPDNWMDGHRGGKVIKDGFSADVIADLSLDWLQGREGSDAPFLLLCHFKATHEPFDYPDRHKDLHAGLEMPEPDTLYDWGAEGDSGRSFSGQVLEILGERFRRDKNGHYPGSFDFPEGRPARENRKAIYQKFVKDFLRSGQAIDDNIGRLLDYLDRSGLARNTIVIYTADQGYFLGEHGFMDKRIMYEEPLRMPMVMRYPAELPAGTELDDLILNIDFAPTLLDFAGAPAPRFMDGRSFRDNLVGKTPADWRESIYYRYWQHLVVRPAHFGIRTKTDKLIFFYGDPLGLPGTDSEKTPPAWEYYNLEDDPAESVNLYPNPRYATRIRELTEALFALKREVGDER